MKKIDYTLDGKIYKFIHVLFIITGTKFYLDWILLTNPTSKNLIIKFLFGWKKDDYSAINYKSRLSGAKGLFIAHLIGFILMIAMDIIMVGHFTTFNVILNLLVNVYPMFVQLYVGYRCWRVKRIKNYIEYTAGESRFQRFLKEKKFDPNEKYTINSVEGNKDKEIDEKKTLA